MDEDRLTGWTVFASMMLMIAGIMRVFDAIWAFANDDNVPEGLQGAFFGKDLTTYGVIWLLVGALLIFAAIALWQGSNFARWVGMIAAAVAAISAIWWIPYYPLWALVYIFIAILVLYGLVVTPHGKDVRDA